MAIGREGSEPPLRQVITSDELARVELFRTDNMQMTPGQLSGGPKYSAGVLLGM